MAASLLASAVALCLLTLSASQEIEVLFGKTGTDYVVGVDDMEWFRSSSLSIRYGGQVWSSTNTAQYMLVPSDMSDEDGEDSIGKFTKRRYKNKCEDNRRGWGYLHLGCSCTDRLDIHVSDCKVCV